MDERVRFVARLLDGEKMTTTVFVSRAHASDPYNSSIGCEGLDRTVRTTNFSLLATTRNAPFAFWKGSRSLTCVVTKHLEREFQNLKSISFQVETRGSHCMFALIVQMVAPPNEHSIHALHATAAACRDLHVPTA